LLIREKRAEGEHHELFSINLRKNLDPRIKKPPIMAEKEVEEAGVGQMIAKLNIFTKPISVFSEEEALVFCPCFVKET
jgi:hypothetical protein